MVDSSSDQARIEGDLQRTRSRMDRRLSELQERLTPGQLLDDAMEYLRGSGGGEFARNLMSSVQRNPLPTALTGIGLAWLMAADPNRQTDGAGSQRWPGHDDAGRQDLDFRLREAERQVARQADEAEDAWRARRDEARGKVLGVVREAQDTAESYARRIDDALATARDGAARTMHGLRDQVSGTASQVGDGARHAAGAAMAVLTANPLLLGALGLAAGALLGALVPQSEQEEAALGGVAGEVKGAVSEMAENIMERGGEAAEHALDAGLESARAHGLMGDKPVGELVEGVRSGGLIEDAKQVAADALRSGDEALRPEGNGQGQPAERTG